jgi:spore coat protein U domain-containing protein, fimbrial subunit CupE1/2/3/6
MSLQSKKMWNRLAGAFVLLSTAAWSYATAASIEATLTVHATVVAGCTELKANPLTFGAYSQGSVTPVEASTTLQLRCAPGVRFILSANDGAAPGAQSRQMTSASSHQDAALRYNLYTDSDFQQVWSSAGRGPVQGTGGGADSPQTVTVFGRIPAGQTPPLGSYTDAVTVTLTF